MDLKTLAWYETQGEWTCKRYESAASPLAPFLPTLFPVGCRVLDIGCGSGRDLALLRSMGCMADGLEPSDAMRAQAVTLHPELAGHLHAGGLPDTRLPLHARYDVVVCIACLMHLPVAQLSDAVQSIAHHLQPGGHVIVSVPAQRPDLDDEQRDAGGRLFTQLSSQAWCDLFARQGFTLQEQIQSADGLAREAVRWLTLQFER